MKNTKPIKPIIFTKEVAREIVDVFENTLEEKDITIPDEDRCGDEGEARIYGMTYDNILNSVENIIILLMKDCSISYKPDTWNSGQWKK